MADMCKFCNVRLNDKHLSTEYHKKNRARDVKKFNECRRYTNEPEIDIEKYIAHMKAEAKFNNEIYIPQTRAELEYFNDKKSGQQLVIVSYDD